MSRFAPNGIDETAVKETIGQLESRLIGALDLQLVLKQIHWNVTGPNFIAVHEMLDEQVAAVRRMSDEIAERIATLGGEPVGTPGHIVAERTWDDYPLKRASVAEHLEALDDVYAGVITDHRQAMTVVAGTDPVTEDLFIGHVNQLELFQWFVRSHLESSR